MEGLLEMGKESRPSPLVKEGGKRNWLKMRSNPMGFYRKPRIGEKPTKKEARC